MAQGQTDPQEGGVPLTILNSAIAGFIHHQELGCRYGTDPNEPAYGLEDIFIGDIPRDAIAFAEALAKWVLHPETNDLDSLWDNRLWNTCLYISKRSSHGTVTLVNKATPQSDRYKGSQQDGYKPDYETFAKNNQNSSDAKVLKEIEYDGVENLVDLVTKAIIELAAEDD
jgi:hypothetical protein